MKCLQPVRSHVLLALSFAATLTPATLMSQGTCPNRKPHREACPEPIMAQVCATQLTQMTCAPWVEHQKIDGDFGCQVGANKQCLEGLTTDKVDCYNQFKCVWYTNVTPPDCDIELGVNPVVVQRVKKVELDCPS